jgi:hypothetical protein
VTCDNEVTITLRSHNFRSELGFEQNYSRWKALDEQKTMVPALAPLVVNVLARVS